MTCEFENARMDDAMRKQEGHTQEQVEMLVVLEGLEREARTFMHSLDNYKAMFSPMTAPTPMSTLVEMMIEDLVEMEDYFKAMRNKIEEM